MKKIFVLVFMALATCAFADGNAKDDSDQDQNDEPKFADKYETKYDRVNDVTTIRAQNLGLDLPAIPDMHNLKFSVLITFSGKTYDPKSDLQSVLSSGEEKPLTIKLVFDRKDIISSSSFLFPDAGRYLWSECHPIVLLVDEKRHKYDQSKVDYKLDQANGELYEFMFITIDKKLLKTIASAQDVEGSLCQQDFTFNDDQIELAKAALYALEAVTK